MNVLRSFLLLALLTFVSNAYSDKLNVADFIINPDRTVDVSVELENTDYRYIMLDFKMQLPVGISLAQDGEGHYLFTQSDRFKSTHSMSISKENEGNVYHFLIYSSKNEALEGNAGELFNLRLTAAPDAASGNYQGRIYEQIFSDDNRTERNPSEVFFGISILRLFSVNVFSENEGYGDVSVSPTSNDGYLEHSTITVTATPKEGYHFVKWSDGTVDNPYSFSVDSDINLSASFTANQYTMTFVLGNGDEDIVITQDYASDLTAPTGLVRDGYVFAGWMPEVPSTVPLGDQTYTAQWDIITYTINYDLAEGTLAEGESNPTTYTVESEAITLNNPTREGYTFAGWTGTGLTEPIIDVTIPQGSTGNRTYTAVWVVNLYTLTFIADGVTLSQEEVAYGASITVPDAPTKEGHTFTGWDGEIPATMPACNLTFTAQYSANQYNVIYIVKGQEWARDKVYFNDPIVLREYTAEEGEIFNGWESDQEYLFMPAHDITYTANITVSTGIARILRNEELFDVYTTSGVLIGRLMDLEHILRLNKGVYIVNGRKLFVR